MKNGISSKTGDRIGMEDETFGGGVGAGDSIIENQLGNQGAGAGTWSDSHQFKPRENKSNSSSLFENYSIPDRNIYPPSPIYSRGREDYSVYGPPSPSPLQTITRDRGYYKDLANANQGVITGGTGQSHVYGLPALLPDLYSNRNSKWPKYVKPEAVSYDPYASLGPVPEVVRKIQSNPMSYQVQTPGRSLMSPQYSYQLGNTSALPLAPASRSLFNSEHGVGVSINELEERFGKQDAPYSFQFSGVAPRLRRETRRNTKETLNEDERRKISRPGDLLKEALATVGQGFALRKVGTISFADKILKRDADLISGGEIDADSRAMSRKLVRQDPGFESDFKNKKSNSDGDENNESNIDNEKATGNLESDDSAAQKVIAEREKTDTKSSDQSKGSHHSVQEQPLENRDRTDLFNFHDSAPVGEEASEERGEEDVGAGASNRLRRGPASPCLCTSKISVNAVVPCSSPCKSTTSKAVQSKQHGICTTKCVLNVLIPCKPRRSPLALALEQETEMADKHGPGLLENNMKQKMAAACETQALSSLPI